MAQINQHCIDMTEYFIVYKQIKMKIMETAFLKWSSRIRVTL